MCTQNLRGGTGSQMGSVLLFDMDGVLLTPGGYHRALQDTVAFLGRCLGFADSSLSQEQIHLLEAAGITNEWDTAAICLAVLVDELWGRAPEQAVGPELLAAPLPVNGVPAPGFDAVIARLVDGTHSSLDPIRRAQTVLPERVHGIVSKAYSLDGLSQRVQQENVLGSEAFERVYGLAGVRSVESYLLAHDRGNLTAPDRARLVRWLDSGGAAAIFTNRPTISPDGRLGTPEGELGARLVGLEDLPLAGSGGIVWLEDREGLPAGTYNKPHPLHALAALRMAMGEAQELAYSLAARMAGGEWERSDWEELDGTAVWVFEDSTAGISSLRIAKEILAGQGVSISMQAIGVTESDVKRGALEAAGATVYQTLSAALKSFFG